MTREPEEPGLFDLPLGPEPEREVRPARPRPETPPENASLFPESEGREEAPAPAREPEAPVAGERPAPRRARFHAGLIDLAAHVALLAFLALVVRAMGIELELGQAPAALLFLAAFSFLYYVPPLAFWGRTPGMARARLTARSLDERPLTFRQAILRWAGALATVALVGIPGLLLSDGRSPADRMSGSRTLQRD